MINDPFKNTETYNDQKVDYNRDEDTSPTN